MDVIDAAQGLFAKKEPWWPHPLILALESQRRGLALDWVVSCCHLLLPHVPTDSRDDLLADIEALDGFRERGATREEILERANAIWYKPPARDNARTAVANLYGALAGVMGGEPSVRALAAPLFNLVWEAENSTELFALVASEYRRFAGKRGLPDDLPLPDELRP